MRKHPLIRIFVAVAASLAGCSSDAGSSGVDMQPGLWQVTTQIEIPGMPVPIPPATVSYCMTADELVPKTSQDPSQGRCETASQSINGNTVSWRAVCQSPQGETVSTGRITYGGDTYHGSVEIEAPGVPPMKQMLNGRRVGDCPKN